MTDFICPKEIVKLFDSEKTRARGRRRAKEWAAELALKPCDRIWLPESGWTVNEAVAT